MKTLITKFKNYLVSKNININLVIGFLVVVGLVLTTFLITKHIEKRKFLEAEKARIELIDTSLKVSKKAEVKRVKRQVEIEDLNQKIEQNEKVNWDDIYASDPDSIASAVAKWNQRFYNNSRQVK